MAKVWFAYEGPEPTPWHPKLKHLKGEMPFDDCVRQLGLSWDNFRTSSEDGMPTFPDPSGLDTDRGYARVVIEIKEKEATTSGWKLGFYVLEKGPDEVNKILDKE